MPRKPETEPPAFTSLREGTTDSRAVQSFYDDLADAYDDTIAEWQYQAPEDACDLLMPHLGDGARILDVGCGTGLMADALLKRCACKLDGIDISAASLRLAEQRGGYDRLLHHDLQDLPLPVQDNAYDAAASVGVMTYIDDAEALLRDVCRSVRAGGVITFTQRTDLWDDRNFPDMIARLEDEGLWIRQQITPPRAYLPGNEDFSDEIKVIHSLCMVT